MTTRAKHDSRPEPRGDHLATLWSADATEAGCEVAPKVREQAVMRLLRGEAPDAVSSELGVSVIRLRTWRNAFLDAGRNALSGLRPAAQDRDTRTEMGWRSVLEELAAGASFERVLEHLARNAEAARPGMLCSILFLESGRLWHYAGPSLPRFYVEAIDGTEAKAGTGSCGTAAATGKRVVVCDVMTDPKWEGFQDLARRANLRACWSEPVVSAAGEVIGTFAMYYREPRGPDESDIKFIETAAYLVRLAMARRRAVQVARTHQKELSQAVRFATLGVMAGAISHELSQPLSAILAQAETCNIKLRKGIQDADAIRDLVQQIATEAERASEIIKRTKSLVRRDQSRRDVRRLKDLVERALAPFDDVIRAQRITVDIDVDRAPPVLVDEVQIEQVLTNLISNAVDAVQGVDDKKISLRHVRNHGGFVSLRLHDSGTPIARTVSKHVLDPFFTTKEKGLGLGLPICSSIIKLHGGTFKVGAEGQGGAKISFTLPRAAAGDEHES